MKIITLTLNPAFDIHASAEKFLEAKETIASIKTFECGGKGVNVSRALKLNGINSTNIVIVGNQNGDSFISGLKEYDLDVKPIYTKGSIRENITVHDDKGIETRLSFTGFSVPENIFLEIRKVIGEVDNDTIIDFSGSNPKGINISEIKSMIKEMQAKGAKIIIDSRSFNISDILEITPWLIKPNIPELCHYFGKDNITIDEAKDIALELNKKGIPNVIVSMDEKGAIYVNNGKAYLSELPKIKAISTIGAGDSTIAGFIKAYTLGLKPSDSIKLANAFGTAKCLREGTLPPLEKDISKIFNNIKVINL